MGQIEITDEALPLLKSGITLKKKLLNIKAENYRQRLKQFEKRHKMKSSVFYKAFTAGKLGDDAEWFDWIFVYEAYKKIREQKKIIQGLSF